MVRNYDPDKPVSAKSLSASPRPRSAPQAPASARVSASSSSPNPDRRQRIADLCGEAEYVEAGFDPWISRAPALFIPCVSEAIYHRRYQEPDKIQDDGTEIDWPVPYWFIDVGATAMLILLAAVDEGLAAGFLGTHRMGDLARRARDTARSTACRRDHGRLPTPRSPLWLAEARLGESGRLRPLGTLVTHRHCSVREE